VTVTDLPAHHLAQARRRAMGSDAHLLVVTGHDRPDAGHLLSTGWARIDELEGLWSRFRTDSEVTALTRHSGTPVVVSAETFSLVEHAIAAWELTDGRFDPTVAAALDAYGYDRDLDDVLRGPAREAPRRAQPAPGLAGTWLDADLPAVALPAGVGFDPGGIGKGLAADMVAQALLDAGAAGALVNLGGDLRAAGEAPDPRGWAIGLPDPLRPGRELARLALAAGAVATSSRLRRRWPTLGGEAHHLIDPATGRPADTPTVAVTVVADRAWRAEALAKAFFLGRLDDLDRHPDVHAIVVTADGQRHATPALAATLR
jgi:thiamine biosynthesis lipoprotein